MDGIADLDVPPGQYYVIARDLSQFYLPDPIGRWVYDVGCGQTRYTRLFQIVRADGRRFACRVTRLTGSELLIIEPEEMIWDDTEQEYPFVFESVGDWDVTVGIEPPDGFVADEETISENINNEEEVVQFSVTEVGSDLVPTKTRFDVRHNGRVINVESNVNIKLTEKYARERGFSPTLLRRQNLIKELPRKRSPQEIKKLEKAKANQALQEATQLRE